MMVQIVLLVVLAFLVIFVVRQARFVLRTPTGGHAQEIPRSLMNLVSLLRILIVVEVCLAVLSIALGLLGRSLLPVELQTFEQARAESELSLVEGLLIAICLPAIVLMIVSWVGLWRLRSWARTVYTLAWLLGLVAVVFAGPAIASWPGELVGELGTLNGGVILGVTYFSDLRHHFGKRNVPSEVRAA